jgi:RecA-family ATPase
MNAQSTAIVSEPHLIIERADQITTKRMRWLWPKRIPLGSITTFAGIPGEGKSLVVADIIARITRGGKFPDADDHLKEPGEVLIISGEDDAETALVPRLEAAC